MKKALIAIIALCVAIAVLLGIGNKHIATEIVINAPPEKVWTVLTDFSTYPEWNPFIIKGAGIIREGATIEVTLKTEGREPMVFTPTIITLKENVTLQWEGRLFMPGIFTGRHIFNLDPLDAGRTRLTQKEDFSGILVPFLSYDSTIAGFTAMNEQLKRRCEGR